MNISPVFYDIFKSPLGVICLTFKGKLLSGVSFNKPSNLPYKKDAAPRSFIKELDSYFNGSNISFSQKIKFMTGTEFEKSVWAVLKKIPFAETRSYKWIAEKVGNPSAVRAVGRRA